VSIANLFAVVGALVGFAVFWLGAMALSAFFGWKTIAKHYPVWVWPAPGEGVPMNGVTMWIGIAGYSRILKAVLTDTGLFLRPYALFSINHEPLFIPWAAMGVPERRLLTGLRVPLAGTRPVAFLGPLAEAVEARLAAASADTARLT